MTGLCDTALLSEIVEILDDHGNLRCQPSLETDDVDIVLAIRISANQPGIERLSDEDATARKLQVVELSLQLQYLVDMAQIRALAQRYGIDASRLEALLLPLRP